MSGSQPSARSPAGTALDSALAALGRRDVSASDLERKLAEKGFAADERVSALATLRRTGLVDDGRYAGIRASALAARGAGDVLIRHDLERSGIPADAIEAAVAGLEAEHVRAERIVTRRGDGPRTRRYLAGRGFSQDAIEALGVDQPVQDGDDCW